MTEDPAESHRSMLATKVDSVLKESMEMSHFKQHLQNPLYGLQSSVSSSHSAFATRMADAVAAAAGVPLIQVFGPTMPLIAWKLSMILNKRTLQFTWCLAVGATLAPIKEDDLTQSGEGMPGSVRFSDHSASGKGAPGGNVTETARRALSSTQHGALASLKGPVPGGDFNLEMERMLSKERQGFREAYKSKRSSVASSSKGWQFGLAAV
jgi:hypothetical protein